MNNLVKTMAIGGGMVIVYIAGKVAGGLEYTRALDKALVEHNLTVKDAIIKVPCWMPLKSHTKVSLEKINKEMEESQQ